MANYDPKMRNETWLFRQIDRTSDGRPVYRRVRFNYVQYDDNPARVLEPVTEAAMFATLDGNARILDPQTDGNGRVVGFEFLPNSRIGDSIALDDYNAAVEGL